MKLIQINAIIIAESHLFYAFIVVFSPYSPNRFYEHTGGVFKDRMNVMLVEHFE